MNALGLLLIECALKASLVTAAGALIFLAARRRGWPPAILAGTATLATVLLATTALLAHAPRWLTLPLPSGARAAQLAGAAQRTPEQRNADLQSRLAAPGGQTSAESSDSLWNSLLEPWQPAANQPLEANWNWPAWLGLLLLCGAGAHLVWLGCGFVEVWRLRRRAAPIDDVALTATCRTLTCAANITRPVMLCESTDCDVPATFGWHWPTIVLPHDWRGWSETQRHAVLAHELAHVANYDFARNVLAQVARGLHFYNPLVRWLTNRLADEQELAADFWAAERCPPHVYVQALAELALSTELRAPPRVVCPLWSLRGNLVRRIEMLKANQQPGNPQAMRPGSGGHTRGMRSAILAITLLAGVLVTALRWPGQGVMAADAQTSEAPEAAEQPNAADRLELTPEAAKAVDQGLKFLAEAQKENGSLGGGEMGAEPAVASLAGLAWLTADQRVAGGPHAASMDKSLKFVLSQMRDDGYLGGDHGSMYGHGLSTRFLAAVWRHNQDAELKKQLERAVRLIEKSQGESGGWRYQPRPADADSSVTACVLSALAEVDRAGVAVAPDVLKRARQYLIDCQNEDGGFCYMQGSAGSVPARSAAAIAALLAAGTAEEKLTRGLDYLLKAPQAATPNTDWLYYYQQYATAQAFAAADPRYARQWYPAASKQLADSQADDGSWSSQLGPGFGTAMACLVLQLPRYATAVRPAAVRSEK